MNEFIPKKKKKIGDIIFIVLLIIMLLFLIPFYSSLANIAVLGAQLLVGTDTYLALIGFIFCLFIMFLGFKYKNNITKNFALILAFIFVISPFFGYFESRSEIKSMLGDYSFKGLTVIQPDECQLDRQVQEQISNALEENFGSDLQIEVEKTTPKNTTAKEKIRCMPSKTHFAYTIAYTDAYGQKKTVVYDSEVDFEDTVMTQSYNILYNKMGEYLREKEGERQVSFTMYIYNSSSGLVELTKKTLLSEDYSLPYPFKLTLENFCIDKRFALEVTFSLVTSQEIAHSIIEELVGMSNIDYPVLIHYGKSTEYYWKGSWIAGDKDDFVSTLKGELL